MDRYYRRTDRPFAEMESENLYITSLMERRVSSAYQPAWDTRKSGKRENAALIRFE